MSQPTFTFPYKYIDGHYRPIIPIGLRWRRRLVRTEGLVDSGADGCIFWAELATALGINVKQGREHDFGGIGSQAHHAYEHRIRLQIGTHETSAVVWFSYDLPDGLVLLGQRGFFDTFATTFNYQQKLVDIQPFDR